MFARIPGVERLHAWRDRTRWRGRRKRLRACFSPGIVLVGWAKRSVPTIVNNGARNGGHARAFAHPTIRTSTRNCHMLRDIKAARNALSEVPPMPIRHRSALAAALWLLTAVRSRPAARHHAAARAADRAAAVLSGRQDEGRAAEATAQPMHRAVSQDRLFHRPPRRSAGISRTQPGSPIWRPPAWAPASSNAT